MATATLLSSNLKYLRTRSSYNNAKENYLHICVGRSSGIPMVNAKRVNGSCMISRSAKSLGSEMKTMINGDHEDDPAKRWMPLPQGELMEEGSLFRQNLVVRSYEIGPDKTTNMENTMNFLQEAAINHMKTTGQGAENLFGETEQMNHMKLIFVLSRIHIQVNQYSSWRDVVEIDTWFNAGKNSYQRDWIVRDSKTQQIITQATSTWAMMNKESRRLSKVPEQVRSELEPFENHRYALELRGDGTERIEKLTDQIIDVNIRSDLVPRWSDIDANMHVNNVKYIVMIFESVPREVLRDYNLTSITLEYRRECTQDDMLESLTSMNQSGSDPCRALDVIESTHLLRFQVNKAEIVRARISWQSKLRN
ncbi:hypothetical protein Dimus_004593 [Dionaea muscipula]